MVYDFVMCKSKVSLLDLILRIYDSCSLNILIYFYFRFFGLAVPKYEHIF